MFESSSPVPFACCKKCVKWTLGEIAKTASPCDITGGAQSRWFHDNRLQATSKDSDQSLELILDSRVNVECDTNFATYYSLWNLLNLCVTFLCFLSQLMVVSLPMLWEKKTSTARVYILGYRVFSLYWLDFLLSNPKLFSPKACVYAYGGNENLICRSFTPYWLRFYEGNHFRMWWVGKF